MTRFSKSTYPSIPNLLPTEFKHRPVAIGSGFSDEPPEKSPTVEMFQASNN